MDKEPQPLEYSSLPPKRTRNYHPFIVVGVMFVAIVMILIVLVELFLVPHSPETNWINR